jgi:succinyl-CoA synthetase beta subunit
VRLVETADALAAAADDILRLRISDRPVVALLLEEVADIVNEFYLAVALDRTAGRPVLLFSRSGGVEVEGATESGPGDMVRVPVDPLLGLREFQVRRVSGAAGLSEVLTPSLESIVRSIWRIYGERDATLVEINPLCVTRVGERPMEAESLVAVDAKISLDDNASFRHTALHPAGAGHEALAERAREAGLAYVRLDGNVGVLGKGAGLVMTLIDLLADAGSTAANFLDIGGGASQQRIESALEVLLDDERLDALLVAVFGGITRCDDVARALLSAVGRRDEVPPVVLHLAGTNAALAAGIVAGEARPGIITAGSLRDAVQRASEIAANEARVTAPLAKNRGPAPDPAAAR